VLVAVDTADVVANGETKTVTGNAVYDYLAANVLYLSGGTMTGSIIGVDSLDLDSGLYISDDITITGLVDGVDVSALDADVAADSASWNTAADSILTDTAFSSEGELKDSLNNLRSEIRDTVNAVIDTITIQFPVWSPDLFTDTMQLFYVDSAKYPYGIKIVSAEICTSVDGTYALNLYEFTAADPPVFAAHIDTLNVGASDQRASSETFTDSDIARGAFIYMDTPATDIDWIRLSIKFYRKSS